MIIIDNIPILLDNYIDSKYIGPLHEGLYSIALSTAILNLLFISLYPRVVYREPKAMVPPDPMAPSLI